MKNNITIQFLGAAGTVTGSKYLIQTVDKTILVDCGLFQGLKELRLLNWVNLPFNVANIDIVLLTHGHLDHVGYLPRLVSEGYKGEIWGTEPTLEIAKIILEDSARIQEEDAERANEKGFSKHKPAKPLYTTKDAENTFPFFRPKQLDKWIKISNEISCRFRYNGHIIGATFIELKILNKILVFSGDIGREKDLLMYPPQKPDAADILFIESTYGDRLHSEQAEKKLTEIINNSAEKKGSIIIPGFAVERIQLLMYLLWKLRKKGAIPNLPIYMDSPMGTNVLDVFKQFTSWHKLPLEECNAMLNDIKQIRNVKETYKLATSGIPKIIIAASGMASGGRILTYFAQYLGDPSATIMLVGFQAEGTRGRALLEGAKEIRFFGKSFPVKATIENLEGLSAHADQKGLIDWLSKLKSTPTEIFIMHGEHKASVELKNKIKEIYGWNSAIPKPNQISQIGD